MIEVHFSLLRKAGKKFYGRWVEGNKEKQYIYKQNVLIAKREEEEDFLKSVSEKKIIIKKLLENDFEIYKN